jgi:hypothetical protein
MCCMHWPGLCVLQARQASSRAPAPGVMRPSARHLEYPHVQVTRSKEVAVLAVLHKVAGDVAGDGQLRM